MKLSPQNVVKSYPALGEGHMVKAQLHQTKKRMYFWVKFNTFSPSRM
jgi:hypothetical protein